jgi:hypothetical protein
MKVLFIVLFTAVCFTCLLAQQHPTEQHQQTEKPERKNFIGLFLGNTVLYQTNIHLPTVGVEYVREITPRFGVGAILEVEIGYQVINDKTSQNPSTLYKRETAVLFQPAVFFRVYKGLIFNAGYGVEFENSEHEKILPLFKIGLEYQLHMQNPNWMVLPSLSWDHTSHYDGVVYGVVFAYKF